jgi:hypothetical protein
MLRGARPSDAPALARIHAARAFHAHHGVRIVAEGDGSANEEGEADVLPSWTPCPPNTGEAQ